MPSLKLRAMFGRHDTKLRKATSSTGVAQGAFTEIYAGPLCGDPAQVLLKERFKRSSQGILFTASHTEVQKVGMFAWEGGAPVAPTSPRLEFNVAPPAPSAGLTKPTKNNAAIEVEVRRALLLVIAHARASIRAYRHARRKVIFVWRACRQSLCMHVCACASGFSFQYTYIYLHMRVSMKVSVYVHASHSHLQRQRV